MDSLSKRDIKYLKGVGEQRARLLAEELDIHTFRDLLYTFPHRYVDRSRCFMISELTPDMPMVQVKGHFVRFSEEGEGAKKRLTALFTDGRSMMEIVWFSRIKAISNAYRPGDEYVVFGKPAFFRNAYSMVHPEVDRFDPARPPHGLRGIYPLTEKLRNRQISTRSIGKMAENLFANDACRHIGETLPAEVVKGLNLMPLHDALFNMHFPSSHAALAAARERMKFEELLYVELHILRYSRERGEKIQGLVFPRIGDAFGHFYSDVLPFPLTGAQKRVLKEIRADMKTGRQMNRLLQGDVGCGKTLVAFMSMLMAVDNDYQACLMAPTEILAFQHFENLKAWGDRIGVKVALLTGSTRTAARREIHAGLRDGSINILVGTHALIEDSVEFRSLGLAVIDEQHRFGVMQRAKMWKKSRIAPHVLIMTATPIPRTLAMTVYGDLDVSVIDELPPGRKPVDTLLRYEDQRQSVYSLVGQQLREGRQAYIVYPLIHENEKLSLKSLEEGYEKICDVFPHYRVCYVHGQMKPAEKDYQMELFVSGEARIMVATTVIEVGVNVPNASVMVIENAERFGLSQLHQLRGRVGRGADQSFCILMSHPNIGKDTRKRLNIMTETTDGFLISEADMKIRGPGDMEGTQQSGIAFNLRVADLARDGQIIQLAREVAGRMLDSNPGLLQVEARTRKDEEFCRLPLSPQSVSVIRRELDFRFRHTFDWSRIS